MFWQKLYELIATNNIFFQNTHKKNKFDQAKFGDSMSCDLKDIFKYAPCHKCHNVTNLVNQRMVLGFLYLKSGNKRETCFYNYTF